MSERSKVVESRWQGRNLTNYKSMHEGAARSKDVETEFQKARTLTQAKKILWGYKKGMSR